MIVETFWFITTVPFGAEMILAIRSAARSTSGSQSFHAVIDLVRHSSKNSPRSSFACAGTQPSECEMKCTQSSSAGNCLRYSSRLSATGSAIPVAYHGSIGGRCAGIDHDRLRRVDGDRRAGVDQYRLWLARPEHRDR